MKVINGYIDGNTVLVNQDLYRYDGMKVMVTIMDEAVDKLNPEHTQKLSEEKGAALDEMFGIWANHSESVSVEDSVRKMREGRHFDS